jgi:hypothetical protein
MVNTKVADAGSSRDYSKGNKLLRVDFKARFVEQRFGGRTEKAEGGSGLS